MSRWSSASPAGSLDYQAPCRHSRVADQNRLKGHIYLNNLIPCLLLLAGVVWNAVAMWFRRRRCCCLDFAVKKIRFPGLGKRTSFCLWVCGLTKVMPAGNYFEFLMRRVAVAVSPRPAAAIPASAIALGVVSPVFASLSAFVAACLPLFVFACLVELC